MELLHVVKAKTPAPSVLVVGAYPEDQCTVQMLKARANGFINKESVTIHAILEWSENLLLYLPEKSNA
jgi:DNA-binding NarL/FixJ family response regulator